MADSLITLRNAALTAEIDLQKQTLTILDSVTGYRLFLADALCLTAPAVDGEAPGYAFEGAVCAGESAELRFTSAKVDYTLTIDLSKGDIRLAPRVTRCTARELNALAIGEDDARHVGVNVRRVKLRLMVAVSALIGVCVSVGGTIGFVGLVVPHMARMLVGPNHGRLLPASMLAGAVFLLLCDLAARTLLRPIELSIGVVTSLVGAVTFVAIFYRTRRAAGC